MVSFVSWKDMYLFLKRYYKYTCLQCEHYTQELDDNETYSDTDYARFFCPHMIAMVRLDFQLACSEWENDNIKLSDINENESVYTFSDKVANILDNIDKKVTIEEVEAIIAAND